MESIKSKNLLNEQDYFNILYLKNNMNSLRRNYNINEIDSLKLLPLIGY